jgi:MscS family membrane protein
MEILTVLSRRSTATSIVQPRTMSIFQMLAKLAVVGAAIYFVFLAWRLDVTAWLASAGIVGIAIGFAAKDTLANLFSGIFIVADAPYKLGDFIVLDGGLRGKVTHIGIRSTRILTIDDVEITVPNAVIGGSKIVNENGGPSPSQRVGISVDAAYGSDIDQVRTVLLACPAGIAAVAATPRPMVLFREMGASGLRFDLLVWIEDASQRGLVIDALNSAVYKAFRAAAIEIPYPKQDVYVKAMPV